ncbi:hypothetical protein Murru_0013 [Allomuricauda ruestringensis DSM 13258]|uniref:Uncharacterized protein n=1 Tax=Allomuricauda ruestringensis (strain DSM 13258 / CIP 107369 / LMG 19739 / B1) TaxID=886377 RepID=G2PQT9_ALLRU|nr:hypothetical protein Murru_0013 [Allomuricauda ruestringensis DSM 13258]
MMVISSRLYQILKLTFFKTVDSLLIGNTTDHKRNFDLGSALAKPDEK